MARETNDHSAMRLTYSRRRQVLRLWTEPRVAVPIEISRSALDEALGPHAVALPAFRHLLLAGIAVHPSGGGVRPHVATFENEDDARAAFRRVRLQATGPADWAQLLAVDARGQLRPVCWFGPTPALHDGNDDAWRTDGPAPEIKPAGRRRRTWTRGRPAAETSDSIAVVRPLRSDIRLRSRPSA